MSKLGDIAKKTLGTQTLKIDEIIEQFGGVVTINSLSYVEYKGDKIPVFGFVEGEGTAFWGGCKKLRELAEAWQEECGDLREVNDELSRVGVKIKLSPTMTAKNGNRFRPVSVLGEVAFGNVANEPAEMPDFDEDTGEIVADVDAAPF